MTLGRGGVGLALGLTFGLLAVSKRDEIGSQCSGNRCTAQGSDLYSDAQTKAAVATWSTVIGVGAAAVGGWLVFTSKPATTGKPVVGFAPRPGGGELNLGRRFEAAHAGPGATRGDDRRLLVAPRCVGRSGRDRRSGRRRRGAADGRSSSSGTFRRRVCPQDRRMGRQSGAPGPVRSAGFFEENAPLSEAEPLSARHFALSLESVATMAPTWRCRTTSKPS